MHHRRTSSVAPITLAQRDALHTYAPTSDEVLLGGASSSAHSRMHRRRRALVLLLALSVFVIFSVTSVYLGTFPLPLPPTASQNLVPDRPYPPLTHLYRAPPHDRPPSSTQAQQTPSITLTPTEELGAIVAYLTSLGANAMIPSTVDPSLPIDPELVLEFNTRSDRARTEVAELVSETWALNPVVLFTEVRLPRFDLQLACSDQLMTLNSHGLQRPNQ